MSNHRPELLQALTQAAYDPAIQQAPALLKLTNGSLASLRADDSNERYVAVVTEMSRQIADYFIKPEGIPVPMAKIFAFVKADVPAQPVDDKALRRANIARGIASIGMTFR